MQNEELKTDVSNRHVCRPSSVVPPSPQRLRWAGRLPVFQIYAIRSTLHAQRVSVVRRPTSPPGGKWPLIPPRRD